MRKRNIFSGTINPQLVTLQNKKRAFTLIEIIVSTAIFTVVVTVAVGALTSLNKTAREARGLRIIMDNANSALDSMSRTVRMGIHFDGGCDSSCVCTGSGSSTVNDTTKLDYLDPKSSGNTCLKFYGFNSDNVLVDTRYRYSSTTKSIERSQNGGASFMPLTAPELEISDMRFFVSGTALDDDQPVVTMLMKGVAKSSNKARDFSVQTSISPRTPNLSIITP